MSIFAFKEGCYIFQIKNKTSYQHRENSVSTKSAKIFPKENREIAKSNHNKVAALLYA